MTAPLLDVIVPLAPPPHDFVPPASLAAGLRPEHAFPRQGGGSDVAPAEDSPSGDCGAPGDAGNETVTAWPATFPCTGNLTSDDVDLYAFHVEAGQLVTVTMTTSLEIADICVLAPDGWTYGCDHTWFEDGSATATAIIDEPGTWYVWVAQWWGVGAYDLTLVVSPAPPANDCGTGGETPIRPHLAPTVASSVTCEGNVGGPGDPYDIYRVELAASQAVSLAAWRNATTFSWACWYTMDLDYVDCNAYDGLHRVATLQAASAAESYYVLLYPSSSGHTSYTMTLAAAAAQDDCGSGTDMPDWTSHAIVALPFSCAGTTAPGDVVDRFQAALDEGGVMDVTITSATPANYCLWEPPEGNYWIFPECFDISPGAPFTFHRPLTASGDWLWGLGNQSARGAYQMDVSTHTPSPQDDCGSGTDASYYFQGHRPELYRWAECFGTFQALDGDTVDAFEAEATPGPVHVTVTSQGAALEPGLCIWRWATSFETACRPVPSGGTVTWSGYAYDDWFWDEDYRFLILVDGRTSPAPYELRLEHDRDCGLDDDAPHRYEDAWHHLGAAPLECEGRMSQYDGGDTYNVTIEEPGLYRLSVGADDPLLDACIDVPFPLFGSIGMCGREVVVPLPPGETRIHVTGGAGRYLLDLERVPILT